MGIAGGRPSSSYYFIGSQADHLFYLDPHFTRPAISLSSFTIPSIGDEGLRTSISSIVEEDGGQSVEWRPYQEQLATFHCDRLRKMPLSSMDPSMLVGFLCASEKDWKDLKERIDKVSLSLYCISHRTSYNVGQDQVLIPFLLLRFASKKKSIFQMADATQDLLHSRSTTQLWRRR